VVAACLTAWSAQPTVYTGVAGFSFTGVLSSVPWSANGPPKGIGAGARRDRRSSTSLRQVTLGAPGDDGVVLAAVQGSLVEAEDVMEGSEHQAKSCQTNSVSSPVLAERLKRWVASRQLGGAR